MYEQIKAKLAHLEALSGVDISLLDIKLREMVTECGCSCCAQKCEYVNVHLYGAYEASRWGGKYVYYCPGGYAFVSVIAQGERDMPHLAAVSGPIRMGEPEDWGTEEPAVNLTAPMVTHFTEVLGAMLDAFREDDSQRDRFLSAVYESLNSETPDVYPIELEQELQLSIKRLDKNRSRELLNRLLGRIFFYSNGDFERIKSRVLELMVLLSRASIEGGAEPGVIFSISDSFMEKAEEAENIEELSVLLSGIINRYIGYIFDFREIKHTDTVYKILSYVKNNYMRKITLDDIASSVYLSKSYLSGIFKDEMGISLTSYIQRIRIEKSVELMENTTLSLSEIADSTGFSDQSYFSKVFREITGFTPNKYRLKTTEEKQETIPPEGRRTGE